MKKIKLFYGILIGLMILSSCSSDDSANSNITNGFKVNGTFYATNFAKSDSGNPYHLILSNPLNHNVEEGQFGSFYMRSGAQGDGIPLAEGTYSTSNGPNNVFGVDGYHPIHFQDNSEEGKFAYSAYWHQDDDFQSGTVTINSITSNSDGLSNQITQIDVDYKFKWDGITIIGNYSGTVEPN